MKQLQEKNPHIGEKTANKATHTDWGLGLPAMRRERSGPQPRGLSSASGARRSGARAGGPGAPGGGGRTPRARSQGAAGGGRPRASAPGPARPPNLVGLRLGGASRLPSLRVGPRLRGTGCDRARHALIISG